MQEFAYDDGPILIFELLQDSARQIFEHENFARYEAWLRDNMMSYVTSFEMFGEQVAPEALAAMAGHLAREVWRLMPLPGNRFRPRPLPKLKPDDPCPCGSGIKYKQCCQALPVNMSNSLEPGLVWALAVPALQEHKLLGAAIASRQMPLEALVEAAVEQFENGKPRKAVALLEPLVTVEQAEKSRPAHDVALNVLCNCYDDLGFHRKKRRLLESIVQQAPRSELRGAAWQRYAAALADEGDREGAWQAFRSAQRDVPDSDSLGVLEVQLLLSENRIDEVPARAEFWSRRLLKSGVEPDNPSLQLLQEMAAGVPDAAQDLGEEDLQELFEWMQAVESRPVERYGYQGMTLDSDLPPGGVLLPPLSLKKVDQAWRRVCPVEKPVRADVVAQSDADPWAPELFARWMKVLHRHPQAWDDLDILDDLVSLLQDEQFEGDPAVEMLLDRVLARSRAIVEASVPEGVTLPWAASENRPALRNLARLAYFCRRPGRLAEAEELADWLLDLNPEDNHGFRWVLMNEYLQAGRDKEAVILALRYPDDFGLETRLGLVLALYRLGDVKAAAKALSEVHRAFPEAVRYLWRKRIRQPEFHDGGFSVGGEDQAWFYREAMRDTWERTEGALEWLKKTAKPS